MAVESERIEFSGNNYFRQRLVLATLSGHAIRIKSIREDDTEPGMNGKIAVNLRCYMENPGPVHVGSVYEVLDP